MFEVFCILLLEFRKFLGKKSAFFFLKMDIDVCDGCVNFYQTQGTVYVLQANLWLEVEPRFVEVSSVVRHVIIICTFPISFTYILKIKIKLKGT